MEFPKHVNSSESASPASPPAFVQELDDSFSKELADIMDSLEPYQEMYHLGGGDFVPLFEEELCETNQQVVPIKQEIETPGYPEPPKMLMEPSDVPMEEILPVPLDNLKVEIPEEIDEDSPKPIVRAPIHRRKPAPVLRTKAYRAELGADAYGLNRFDRLLAKMPKSKAGRKKKFATTNMSRNALAARENRDKKKEYVEELEDGVRCLNGLFKKVLDELEETDRTCTSLKEAVNYYVRLIAELKLNAFQREG